LNGKIHCPAKELMKKNKGKFKIKFSAKDRLASVSKLPFLKLIYLSIFLNVFTMLGILLLKKNISPELPLFYGLPEGESQIASNEELIIPSMISLLVILINITISSVLQNEFLKRVLIIVSLIITLLGLTTTLEIFFLIGSF